MDTEDAFPFESDISDGDWSEYLLQHELNDIGLALRVQALRESHWQ